MVSCNSNSYEVHQIIEAQAEDKVHPTSQKVGDMSKAKCMTGTLIKLCHRSDAHVPQQDAGIHVHQFFKGTFERVPTAGTRFFMEEYADSFMISSIVKSVYHVDGLPDKLVLPSKFPERERLEIPDGVRSGDYIFATMNSIYWLLINNPKIKANKKPTKKKRPFKK